MVQAASPVVTRAQIAERFRAAKSILAVGIVDLHLEKFICHALKRSARTPAEMVAAIAARDVIASRMGADEEDDTLYVWCGRRGLLEDIETYVDRQQAVQDFRHLWLDELIREFSDEQS